MAAYNKHNDFVDQLGQGKHVFGTHVFKLLLTNTAPTAANAIKADLTEITAANGYTAGGPSATITWAETTGTATATGTAATITAAGGTIGPFRYIDLYNDTQTTPAKPLVAWWDYGSALTLQDGETFTWKPNNSATTGTVFTLV